MYRVDKELTTDALSLASVPGYYEQPGQQNRILSVEHVHWQEKPPNRRW